MRSFAIIALAGLTMTSAALAQPNVFGTIQDGPAIFTITPGAPAGPGDNVSDLGNGPSTYFTVNGAGGPNYLPNAWWWGRVSGVDGREFAVWRPQAQTTVSFPSASRMRIVYDYSGQAAPFQLIMEWSVSGFVNGFGSLTQTCTVLNLDPTNTYTFNLYNFNNPDVFGTPGNDTAQQTGPNTVQFVDGIFPVVRASYEGATGFRVDTRPNILGLLTNGGIDNMVGGVINNGPADLEIASQFVFDLAPFSTQSVSATITIIPTPGALALLGVGGLAAARRRRA